MKRLTVKNALNELTGHPQVFKVLFSHGSLEIEIFKPHRIDEQKPHRRDEIYVIATGQGYFLKAGQKQPVEAGEVLFVPAGIEHKFVDFSENFSAWVFFYGPEGGEELSVQSPL